MTTSVEHQRPGAGNDDGDVLVHATGITKSYGRTRALDGVDVTLGRGEVLGLVGHNGAGKSTLVRTLAGIEPRDGGRLTVAGYDTAGGYDLARAESLGVRMAFQELSLGRRIAAALDQIFPGHGISVHARVGDLPISQRQMVEIARATLTEDLRLLILDEPTESLGPEAARSMYRYIAQLTARGGSVLLISHRMQEVLEHAGRVAVLRDGKVSGIHPSRELDEPTVLRLMGGDVQESAETPARRVSSDAAPVVRMPVGAKELLVRPGEIVGLTGLAGQGQAELIERMWAPGWRRSATALPRRRAFVPGDRQTSGILPLWSVAQNLAAGALRRISRRGVVRASEQRALVSEWVERLAIKGETTAPITSLSGGNQQKVLVARAFGSDAELILLDDPFRGVDVQTKNEIYALMRAEAAGGRSIVWYTTQNAEMAHCDRAYVFRAGTIVAELHGSEISEERIVAESFATIEEGAAA